MNSITAIFGCVGAIDPSFVNRMHRRLRHRGANTSVLELDGYGWMAVAGADPSRDASAERLSSVVVDSTLYGLSESGAQASAAESALESYAGHGAAFIDGIGGDFAVALWDGQERRLLLARDFSGSKPLYWTKLNGGAFAFASEYKALLVLPGFDPAPDREMLQRLQFTKHLPSDRTLFRSIRAVPPGTAIFVVPGGRIEEAARIVPPPLAVSDAPAAELEGLIAQSFLQAVRIRVRSGSRVGIALSGGIDSIGVAFASRKESTSAELHAFTAGSGPDDQEIRTAARVCKRLGITHHVVTIGPTKALHEFPRAVWHMENPIARSEAIQFLELGRAAEGKVDTLLMGSAADALYAGMPNNKILRLYEWLPPLRRALREFHSLSQTGYVPASTLGALMKAVYFKGRLPPPPRILGAKDRPALTELPQLGPEFINEYLHAEFPEHVARWLPKVERTLAASGVGVTSPFLDRRCARVAFTVPERLKLRGWEEKYILRRALRGLVDEDFTGFAKFPMRMKYDAEFADCLDELIEKYLAPERVRKRQLFDPPTLDPVRGYRRGGRYSAEGAMRAWTAIGTEIWAEQFLDRNGESPE